MKNIHMRLDMKEEILKIRNISLKSIQTLRIWIQWQRRGSYGYSDDAAYCVVVTFCCRSNTLDFFAVCAFAAAADAAVELCVCVLCGWRVCGMLRALRNEKIRYFWKQQLLLAPKCLIRMHAWNENWFIRFYFVCAFVSRLHCRFQSAEKECFWSTCSM